MCIEITETALRAENNVIIDSLKIISSNNIPTSLDDFGTGYNNLNNLADVSLTQIKIDRSFIKHRNLKKEKIIESLIELAHSMGVEVVAEGIETEGDFDFIKSLNCDYSQGYYHARPMPQSETMLYMKKHSDIKLITEDIPCNKNNFPYRANTPLLSEQ